MTPKRPSASSTNPAASVTLADFQALIRNMYLAKDQARGVDGTFMWLMEEVGELAAALRDGSHDDRLEEFADVLAWLTTIANVCEVDLTEAVQRLAPAQQRSLQADRERYFDGYLTY